MQLLQFVFLLAVCHASLFDFIQNQFGGGSQAQRSPEGYENEVLNANCDKYLCPGTSLCVDAPKFCPCPYPSSQLRCFLPDGRYLCISKPAGDAAANYDDPRNNWKVDAKDDSIRDCGWVSRAWKGIV